MNRWFGALLFFCAAFSAAQDQPATKISGLVFGDYFYKISGDSSGSVGQYAPLKKDEQGFQLRRLYLYVDHSFSDRFATQLLLEGNDKSFDPGGRQGVFVKTAFVEWKEIFPMSSFQIGLIPTPTWISVAEKIWNYRPIEKTIADFRGLGVATDFGASLRGKLTGDGLLGYHVMIGNGNGQKPETNKFKKFYGALDVKPANTFTLQAYADYEPAPGTADRTTLKGFAAYEDPSLTVGAEAVQQLQLNGAGNRRPLGFGLFARAPIPGASGVSAFARFDYFDNDANESSTGFRENFITIGLDYMPVENVHFMPNVWINTYADKSPANVSRDADVAGRLTFFFVYR
jgi:hypothetical protein